MKNPIPEKGDNLSLQLIAMKSLFPSIKYQNISGKGFWIGSLCPGLYCDTYQVKIEYRKDSSPKAFIKAPKLKDGCPHIYPSDGSLCLFYPKEQKWQKQWLIAKRFVPWICEFLLFYEYWLETGNWFGDAAPHSDTKELL